MCLIFVSLKHHPAYKLIVAANRDEFYNRKTAAAAYWQDHPEILGGRDLEAMGTWLAMTKGGRIAMVTNFRDLRNLKAHAPSRGKLVTDFLLDDVSGQSYLKKIEPHAKEFNGFSLIAGTVDSLSYLSNYRAGLIELSSGLFGLSNHLLETPWPKVEKGKREIQALLSSAKVNERDLFEVLSDDTISTDDMLPDTGVGLERERSLSAAFIRSPGYGTRSSTVILADYNNNVEFHERVFDPDTSRFSFNSFRYAIV
jgi:uncharacterized protein with NRDE domain